MSYENYALQWIRVVVMLGHKESSGDAERIV